MKDCSICGSKINSIGSLRGIQIYKCTVCGLGVTDKTSRLDYTNYHRDEVYAKETEQFKNIFQKRANIILRYKKSGRVLDIGSSTGAFLSIFKSLGWEVLGIEPSKSAASAAEKSGIKTINSVFEKSNIQGEFDVVILNHVLEHVENPIGVLEKVNRLLKKEGIALVDVPNFGSLSAKVGGIAWQYLLPHEHLWHFTKKSLQILFVEVGLEIVYQETHSGIWGYGNPALELWQSLISGKKRFFGNLATAFPSWVVSKAGWGTGLTIVAKKK